jgi:hypothetical protein
MLVVKCSGSTTNDVLYRQVTLSVAVQQSLPAMASSMAGSMAQWHRLSRERQPGKTASMQ